MKINLLKTLFIVLAASVVMFGCKKDTNKTDGRWDATKAHRIETQNGVKISESTEAVAADESYLIFKGNTFEEYEDGKQIYSGTFTATDNFITFKDNDSEKSNHNFRWNSQSEFVIVYESSYKSYTYKNEVTYKKR